MGAHQTEGRTGTSHHHHSLTSPVEAPTTLQGNLDRLRDAERAFRELQHPIPAADGMNNGLRIIGLPITNCSKIAYVTHLYPPSESIKGSHSETASSKELPNASSRGHITS